MITLVPLVTGYNQFRLVRMKDYYLLGTKIRKISVISLQVYDIFVTKSKSMEICYYFSHKSTNNVVRCTYVFFNINSQLLFKEKTALVSTRKGSTITLYPTEFY